MELTNAIINLVSIVVHCVLIGMFIGIWIAKR